MSDRSGRVPGETRHNVDVSKVLAHFDEYWRERNAVSIDGLDAYPGRSLG
jgi:hypothetical protein